MFFCNQWNFNDMSNSKLDGLIENDDTTIEDFFHTDNFLMDQKLVQKKFGNHIMRKPEKLKTLIDYCYLQNSNKLIDNLNKAYTKKENEKDDNDNNNKSESESEVSSEQNKEQSQKKGEDENKMNEENQNKAEQKQNDQKAIQHYDQILNKFPFFASEVLNEDSLPQLGQFLFGKYNPNNPDNDHEAFPDSDIENNSIEQQNEKKEDNQIDEEKSEKDQNENNNNNNSQKIEIEEEEGQGKNQQNNNNKKDQELLKFRNAGSEILKKIFAFLDQNPEQNPNYDTCAIYFSKIAINLLQSNNDISQYLKSNPELMEKMFNKINNKSIAEFVSKFIIKDLFESENQFIGYKIEITQKVIEKIKHIDLSDFESYENCIFILQEILNVLQNNKYQNYQENQKQNIQEVENLFFKSENLSIISQSLFDNIHNQDIVQSILELITKMFLTFTNLGEENEQNNLYANDESEDLVNTDEQKSNERFPFEEMANILAKLIDHIGSQNGKLEEQQASMKEPKKVQIGIPNYLIASFLVNVFKCEEVVIQEKMKNQSIFTRLFQFFKISKNNTLVQSQFDLLFCNIIKLDKENLLKEFLQETQLLQFIKEQLEQTLQEQQKLEQNLEQAQQTKLEQLENRHQQKGFVLKFIDSIKEDIDKNSSMKIIITQSKENSELWDEIQNLLQKDKSIPPPDYDWGQIFDKETQQNNSQTPQQQDSRGSNNINFDIEYKKRNKYQNFTKSDDPGFMKKKTTDLFGDDDDDDEEDKQIEPAKAVEQQNIETGDQQEHQTFTYNTEILKEQKDQLQQIDNQQQQEQKNQENKNNEQNYFAEDNQMNTEQVKEQDVSEQQQEEIEQEIKEVPLQDFSKAESVQFTDNQEQKFTPDNVQVTSNYSKDNSNNSNQQQQLFENNNNKKNSEENTENEMQIEKTDQTNQQQNSSVSEQQQQSQEKSQQKEDISNSKSLEEEKQDNQFQQQKENGGNQQQNQGFSKFEEDK